MMDHDRLMQDNSMELQSGDHVAKENYHVYSIYVSLYLIFPRWLSNQTAPNPNHLG